MTTTPVAEVKADPVREVDAALNFRCPFCGTPVVIKYVVRVTRWQVHPTLARVPALRGQWFARLTGRERRQRVDGGRRHGELDAGHHACVVPEATR